MQIVIDIPEMTYNLLKSDSTIDWLDAAETILDRIVEGIVLPKGHGDLIDKNNIICDIHGTRSIMTVLNAPIIIPADKERS